MAELHINRYLAAADPPKGVKPQSLIMPPHGAPSLTFVPDLGNMLRDIVLNRSSNDDLLSTCLRQSIPCLRKSHTTPLRVEPGGDVVLSIMFMGLFLGLFPSVNKKPPFASRVRHFRSFHALVTSTVEEQVAFLQSHQSLVNLALLEYVIMMTTHFMPAERDFLVETFALEYYYQHVSTWADEFRTSLSTVLGMQDLDRVAKEIMDRSARVKRKVQHPRAPPVRSSSLMPHIETALATPVVELGSTTDYEVLLATCRLPMFAREVQGLHQAFKVGVLPNNIREVQVKALQNWQQDSRILWARAHIIVCARCIIVKDSVSKCMDLRTDTVYGNLVCSSCSGLNILHINMVGRCLNINGCNYALCPHCCSVHPVLHGSKFSWMSKCGGVEVFPQPKCKKKKMVLKKGHACSACSDVTTTAQPVERIDHLTGEVITFYFCQRHVPGPRVLQNHLNARMLSSWSGGAQPRRKFNLDATIGEKIN